MRDILSRFERQHEQLVPKRQFATRMLKFVILGMSIEAVAIFIGSLGFHFIGGLDWLDGALNAAMVITGNGPTFEPQTDAAKIFQIIFTLSGVIIFVLVLSVVLAPIFHRVLHHFHISPEDSVGNARVE